MLEVCVDSIESALNAEEGGAGRIELCSALSEGGLTPSIGIIQAAKRFLNIPVFVMVRPRSGDFCYSQPEAEVMLADIQAARTAGADGVVTGALKPDGTVDRDLCCQLVKAALPLPVTFHRAFDHTSCPKEALEDVACLGFQRILTSGQCASAEEGIPLMRELVSLSQGRLTIMAGTGINPTNAYKVVNLTGVKEFHASARTSKEPPVVAKNSKECKMGSADDYMRLVTDASVVRLLVEEGQRALISQVSQ